MTTTTKEKLGAVLSSGGAHTLGAMVFWSLSGAHIRRDEFRARLADLGLDEAMPRDPSPKGALSKTVSSVMTGKRGVLARRIRNGFGLVLERLVDDGRRLEVDHVATVGIKDSDLDVTYVEPEHEATLTEAQPDLIQSLKTEYAEVRDFVQTPDLSEILSTALNGSPHRGLFAALSLRERTGGLYFIHGSHVERMQRFKALVEQMAPHSSITVLTITGDSENLDQTAAVAKTTFAAQLAGLKAELVEFTEHLRGSDKSASEYSIATRAERYKELRARVDLFRDVLGDVATDLTGQIEDAKNDMVKQLEAL